MTFNSFALKYIEYFNYYFLLTFRNLFPNVRKGKQVQNGKKAERLSNYDRRRSWDSSLTSDSNKVRSGGGRSMNKNRQGE